MNDEIVAPDQAGDAPPPADGEQMNGAIADADGPAGAAQPLLEAHQELLSRYRASLLAGDPSVPPQLVVGETAEEIEASFQAARELVAGIRESVRREQPAIPAGAPGRGTAVPSTAYDKIRSGLARLAAS